MGELLKDILFHVAQHLGYTLVSVSIGFVLGLSLGMALSRFPKVSKYLIPVLSILNTVPGICLLYTSVLCPV